MTTVASFVTISPQKKKLYLMSDSKVTWGNTGLSFNNSTKVFPLKNSPDVFAYSGDSLFSLSVLSRLKIQLEFYYFYCTSYNSDWKKEQVLSFLNASITNYPKDHMAGSVTISHYMAIQREQKFYGFKYYFDPKTMSEFDVSIITIPEETSSIDSHGSGGPDYRIFLQKYINQVGEQAYSIFYAFYKFINSNIDRKTGGPIQVVQLDSNGETKPIGVLDEGEICVLGESKEFWTQEYNIELRSKYFELVDLNGTRLSGETDRSYLDKIKI